MEVGQLLRQFREQRGLSQNALARRMGVNPAYVNRLEHGGRGASNRALIERAAVALELSAAERDALLSAAGHLPQALQEVGPTDPTLQLVADLLADPAVSAADKALFRAHVRLAALPWRPLLDQERTQFTAWLSGIVPNIGTASS
ncbi:MAG: helix-turn-helix domain-containing protein [Chloroflexi bacterium]|nr:helix-turn-helix domain-containing protein [Chloroflexota bacterium]